MTAIWNTSRENASTQGRKNAKEENHYKMERKRVSLTSHLLVWKHRVLARIQMLHGMCVWMTSKDTWRAAAGHHAHHRACLTTLGHAWSSHAWMDGLPHGDTWLRWPRHTLVRWMVAHWLSWLRHTPHGWIERLCHTRHHRSVK